MYSVEWFTRIHGDIEQFLFVIILLHIILHFDYLRELCSDITIVSCEWCILYTCLLRLNFSTASYWIQIIIKLYKFINEGLNSNSVAIHKFQEYLADIKRLFWMNRNLKQDLIDKFLRTKTLKTFSLSILTFQTFSFTMQRCNKGCPCRYSKGILQLFGCLSRWQTHQKNFTFDSFCCTFKSFSIFPTDLYANAKVILNLKRIVRNNLNKNISYKTSFWKFDNTLKIITSIFTRFYRTVDIFICKNNERYSFRWSIINTYVANDWDCVLLKLFILNFYWVFMIFNIYICFIIGGG